MQNGLHLTIGSLPRFSANPAATPLPHFARIFMTNKFQSYLWFALIGIFNWVPVVAQESESPVDRRSQLLLISDKFGLADGPSWNGWSLDIPDVKGQKLYRYHPTDGRLQVLDNQAGRISATFFNHGRLYLSDNSNGEIAFRDGKEKKTISSFKSLDDKGSYRPNDLVVDRLGGIYVTFTPQGKVLYVKPDGATMVAVENVTTPNGITLSPDEKTLYVSEFVPKKIKSYEISSPGVTANGKVLASMDDGPERGADGMTIDRAGNIYCAGPSDIWIWNPSGKLLDKIRVPEKPINCVLGGRDMRTLFVTGFGGLYGIEMKISGRSPQPLGTAPKLIPPAKNLPSKSDVPSTEIPSDVKTALDVCYTSYGERKLLADVFMPANGRQTHPCLLLVHGGGWHNGDKTKFRALAIALAKKGFVTAAIEYRLAEESPFPAAVYDCFAAVRYFRANASRFGIDGDRIGAVGGSAGGHLVGLMASAANNPKLTEKGGNQIHSARIQAAVVMAGPMEMLTGSVAKRSRSGTSDPAINNPPGGKPKSNSNSWLRATVSENPELYRQADAHVQIDKNTCPILFLVGEHDNPARNQPSRDKLKSLGILTGLKTYSDGKHGCWNRQPWFDLMVKDMDDFFKKVLN